MIGLGKASCLHDSRTLLWTRRAFSFATLRQSIIFLPLVWCRNGGPARSSIENGMHYALLAMYTWGKWTAQRTEVKQNSVVLDGKLGKGWLSKSDIWKIIMTSHARNSGAFSSHITLHYHVFMQGMRFWYVYNVLTCSSGAYGLLVVLSRRHPRGWARRWVQ